MRQGRWGLSSPKRPEAAGAQGHSGACDNEVRTNSLSVLVPLPSWFQTWDLKEGKGNSPRRPCCVPGPELCAWHITSLNLTWPFRALELEWV